MFKTVRAVNGWFRLAKKSDIDNVLSEIILSERQEKIFRMFYLKKQDINFIADTLFVSPTVVSVELKAIRDKVYFVKLRRHESELMALYRGGASVNSLAKRYGVRWATAKAFITKFSKMERPKPLSEKPRKHGHQTYREKEWFDDNN